MCSGELGAVLASVSSGSWSAGVSAALSLVLRFLRGCWSETSLWVRVRRPLGRVLVEWVEPSDARLFLPAVLGAVDVAAGAGLCSSGVWVPFMGVMLLLLSCVLLLLSSWVLASREPLHLCGEPEADNVRLRLAGRASSCSPGASSFCAFSSSELRRLPELALDGPAELVWFEVPFAPRRVVIWNGTEGARRDVLEP